MTGITFLITKIRHTIRSTGRFTCWRVDIGSLVTTVVDPKLLGGLMIRRQATYYSAVQYRTQSPHCNLFINANTIG